VSEIQEDNKRCDPKALAKSLGSVGMVRFLQQFDNDSGDYAREREKWLGESLTGKS